MTSDVLPISSLVSNPFSLLLASASSVLVVLPVVFVRIAMFALVTRVSSEDSILTTELTMDEVG